MFSGTLPLRLLCRAHGDDQLPFAFTKMEDAVISTLNIQKPVPLQLKFINLEDSFTTRIGHVAAVPLIYKWTYSFNEA